MRPFCLLLTALLWFACAESARDALTGAREALAEARYSDAIAEAEAGLGLEADAATHWGLQLVKLESLARAGRGDEAVALIGTLAEARPEQMPASQYAATADQLRSAGAAAAAVRVLDLGLKRFPEDEPLAKMIEAARSAPAAGSEELEMLRSLGYVK